MSGDGNSSSDEVELDFEWDDALSEFDEEVQVQSESRQVPAPAPPSGSRPLYRPPSDPTAFAHRGSQAPPVPPAPKAPEFDASSFLPLGDDDSLASTAIASIPQDLINSLVEGLPDSSAPGARRSSGPPMELDLADLTELEDELEDEDEEPPMAPAQTLVGHGSSPPAAEAKTPPPPPATRREPSSPVLVPKPSPSMMLGRSSPSLPKPNLPSVPPAAAFSDAASPPPPARRPLARPPLPQAPPKPEPSLSTSLPMDRQAEGELPGDSQETPVSAIDESSLHEDTSEHTSPAKDASETSDPNVAYDIDASLDDLLGLSPSTVTAPLPDSLDATLTSSDAGPIEVSPELQESETPQRSSSIPPPSEQQTGRVTLSDPGIDDVAQYTVEVDDDAGAAAARRSWRTGPPKEETFPLVGNADTALRLRRRLLTNLARVRDDGEPAGGVRARLLVAAAEISERLGETETARADYRAALQADPHDVIALRALRRDAVRQGDTRELVRLLEIESELDLSPAERTSAYLALAELSLSSLGDLEKAQRAADQARALSPDSVPAALLSFEVSTAQGRNEPALEALRTVAPEWHDDFARCAIRTEEAALLEKQGEYQRAANLYQEARTLDPEALDAWFGLARVCSAPERDGRLAVEALSTLASYLPGGVQEAVTARAALVAHHFAHDNVAAALVVAQASDRLGLRAALEVARSQGEPVGLANALRAYAERVGGRQRATALVEMAELAAASGDYGATEVALREAALADGSLPTTQLVKEIIARRTGDRRWLTGSEDAALPTAARSAMDASRLAEERDLLATAMTEGNSLVTADVVGLDAAAEAGDRAAVNDALRRQVERAVNRHRVGPLLALTESAVESEDLAAAIALLEEARQYVDADPLVLRPLGRLALSQGPQSAAARWMEEAEGARADAGEQVADADAELARQRYAFAATQAARVLAGTSEESRSILGRTLEREPGYGPAGWLLTSLATSAQDVDSLAFGAERRGEAGADPSERAASLVRAAMLRAEAEPDLAATLLNQAYELIPDDAVLTTLLLRWPWATPPDRRAAILTRTAAAAPPKLSRLFRYAAAGAYEDAEDPKSAADEYRRIHDQYRDDPFVLTPLDRTEIASGQAARVATRRMAAVKSAQTDAERVLALEALAELDQLDRNDLGSAVLSLQSILEFVPGHLPSLRALSRYFAEQNRTDALIEIVETLTMNLRDRLDVSSHARLARRLRMFAGDSEAGQDADAILLRVAPLADLNPWFAPRLFGAASQRGERQTATQAAIAMIEHAATSAEQASAAVRAAELEDARENAAQYLQIAIEAHPDHPVALPRLAEIHEASGRTLDAAQAWELAAESTRLDKKAATYFHHAATLWQELSDRDRAISAFQQAAACDVTYGDTFDRLRELLGEGEDNTHLAELYGQRLKVETNKAAKTELYVAQAQVFAEMSDFAAAKAALRAALAISPERIDALRRLARLSLEDKDWRGATEVLIKIARQRQKREELRWVFFTLGDIYDRHLPDARRATAAFQRVLKLIPGDVEALERLSEIYEREGQQEEALRIVRALGEHDRDPDRNRDHALRLCRMLEESGDLVAAEQVLEDARAIAPTDLEVLRGLAEFYERAKAPAKLQAHLSRSIKDFRHALGSDLSDAAAWAGLTQVLWWCDQRDAAAAVTSSACALGYPPETPSLVDGNGAASGAMGGCAASGLDALTQPSSLSSDALAAIQVAHGALERAFPIDLNAYHAQPLGPGELAVREVANEIATWFGLAAPELYATAAAPRVCVPVFTNPPVLLIGRELISIAEPPELYFVLTRALKIVQAQLSLVVRLGPAELHTLATALIRRIDPSFTDPYGDQQHAQAIADAIERELGAEQLRLLAHHANGLNRTKFEPGMLAMSASEWGDRTGLIAIGSAPAALSALAKLSGEPGLPDDLSGRLGILERHSEAASLLKYSLSDAFFEARRRAMEARG